MSDAEMSEFKEVLAGLQAGQQESSAKLHDLTLAIVGDDSKGILGIVQRMQAQSKRVRIVEALGSFVWYQSLDETRTGHNIYRSLCRMRLLIASTETHRVGSSNGVDCQQSELDDRASHLVRFAWCELAVSRVD